MMINDILDYSQISNGKLRLIFEEIDLWQVIKDVSKLFKFQAKLKGIKFTKENHIQVPQGTKIVSDQNRLKQVLFNLLGNALKFTVKGSIKILLKKVVLDENDSFSSSNSLILENNANSSGHIETKESAFYIAVEDTGIGIKKEDQANLFTMFGCIQNEQTKSINKSGVGLGLAISQSLGKELNHNRENGEIKVFSEYKKGSRFSFILYQQVLKHDRIDSCYDHHSEQENIIDFKLLHRNIAQDRWKKHENHDIHDIHEILDNKNESNISVLVVDDDQINILVLTNYLKSMGNVLFDAVFDGEDAVETVRKKAGESSFYDIILMDCNMPRMNGFEASIIINKMIQSGQIPKLSIIACTANTSQADLDELFKCGIEDSIAKPINKEDLKKKLYSTCLANKYLVK